MNNDESADAATEAFEAVRDELARLRAAVENLTAARSNATDYTETLGVIHNNVLITGRRLESLSTNAMLKFAPEEIVRQVDKVAADLGRGQQQLADQILHAVDELRRPRSTHVDVASANELRAGVGWLIVVAAFGFVLGLASFAAGYGAFARAMPASLHLPELFAADVVGKPMWEAGERMMRVADPDRLGSNVADQQLVAANRETLKACTHAAPGRWKQLPCMIKIQPS